VEEASGDRLVIALSVTVHAADALVVAADDSSQLGIEVDVGAAGKQIGRRREVGFVSPFLAREAAREQAFADMLDLGVRGEEAGSEFGLRSGPSEGPIEGPGLS
jgi:hypothetical protein